jgi:O-antigen biosynthesis protein
MYRVLMGWTDRTSAGLLRSVLPVRFLRDRLLARGVSVSLQDTPGLDDEAEAVVVRRGLTDTGIIWVVSLKARGARVVLDMDDDLWRVPRGSTAWRPETPGLVRRTLALTDEVWVSTVPLAERVREERFAGPVRVLPNLLDAAAFPARRSGDPADPVRVLWYGSDTHRIDLDRVAGQLGAVFTELLGEAELVLWGDGHPDLSRMLWGRNLTLIPWQPLEQFAGRLVELRPDICLCPLDAGEPFNHCKSPLKFLESSLAGAASIVSDCPPYRGLVRDGETGLVARNGDWADDVRDLVRDEPQRRALAQAARDQVLADHTWQLSPAAGAWEEAFAGLAG